MSRRDKSRIFDRLNGDPEDRVFSRVARAMRNAPSWREVPVYVAPGPVSGEVES